MVLCSLLKEKQYLSLCKVVCIASAILSKDYEGRINSFLINYMDVKMWNHLFPVLVFTLMAIFPLLSLWYKRLFYYAFY